MSRSSPQVAFVESKFALLVFVMKKAKLSTGSRFSAEPMTSNKKMHKRAR